MNRRDFLNLSLTSGGLYLASNLSTGLFAKAFAQSLLPEHGAERFFVQLHMDGGWDITLGLNPWTQFNTIPSPSDYFLEYGADALMPIGNGFVGPALEPMKAHSQDIAVVNGVFMSSQDNGHLANKNYISTGNGQSKDAYLCVEYEASSIKSAPFGVLTTDSIFTADREVQTISVANCLDLSTATLNSSSAASTPLQRLSSNLSVYSPNISKAQAELAALKIDSNNQNAQTIEKVALCFKHGLSRSTFARVELGNLGGLDTHSDHTGKHLAAQKAGWESVAQWFKIFKETEFRSGESLFSRTTFLVTSEFSRTPALTASKGKNHNPYANSVLLAGAGVQGGLVIGGSSLVAAKDSQNRESYLVAQAMDMDSGRGIASQERSGYGVIVTPEIIASTIAEILRVDRKVFSNGYKAPVLPAVVKP